ncbi:uncharacterized protein LOC106470798 isoform X2 [Limulus polyphemus]|uniref:Uncharacterized protein LOC106470798 isoform X2 n=1 Tax=Limulus polyphemus TaxID=6850 RepID=A0ABM1BQQ1_LIMPO|nr:uncharacterized protein LOC106470798 isoform X2 [Limulus polyphemus]
MKVLFAALVVLVSLMMTKGNVVDISYQLMCKMNKEKPETIKELRQCIGQFFNGKPKWLHGAIQECKNEKFPSEKFDKYLTEMCTEEREADLQDVKECIGEQFAAAQVDQETSYTEIINKCF